MEKKSKAELEVEKLKAEIKNLKDKGKKGKKYLGEILDDELLEMVDRIFDYASKVPKEVVAGLFFSYLWSTTHEGGMNEGDLTLGMIGGFTVPPALTGGIEANSYALAYLACLGMNTSTFEEFLESFDNMENVAKKIIDAVEGGNVDTSGRKGTSVSEMRRIFNIGPRQDPMISARGANKELEKRAERDRLHEEARRRLQERNRLLLEQQG